MLHFYMWINTLISTWNVKIYSKKACLNNYNANKSTCFYFYMNKLLHSLCFNYQWSEFTFYVVRRLLFIMRAAENVSHFNTPNLWIKFKMSPLTSQTTLGHLQNVQDKFRGRSIWFRFLTHITTQFINYWVIWGL